MKLKHEMLETAITFFCFFVVFHALFTYEDLSHDGGKMEVLLMGYMEV
jgi:hypothetical protein